MRTMRSVTEEVVTKPFAGYENFADCVAKNQDQDNPEAYCATIMRNDPAMRREKQVVMPRTVTVQQGMAAFYLPAPLAEELAIVPSLDLTSQGIEVSPPDEMHITLAYFPAVQDEDKDALIQQVAMAASCFMPTVATVIEGVAQFLPSESSKDRTPYVALVDPTQLEELHERLASCCAMATDVADNHGFIPHITLAYVPSGSQMQVDLPSALPLTFSTLTLMIGDERHDFALGGGGMAYMSVREKLAPGEESADRSERPAPVASRTTGQVDMSTATIVSAEKAVWSSGYINDLPNSSFLYIEPGASNDADGKTEPRSQRHFPYKDASGAVDLPHLRNAIARLPQSNAPGLTPEKIQSLQARARDILANATKEKSGRRMSASWRNRLAELTESIKAFLSWADYEDEAEKDISATSETTFFVFKDASGSDRWLSFSSNAFRDREKEIISTQALEAGVELADKTGQRGPLRLWHSGEASNIGTCDFQGVEGRFLIESGLFDDTDIGMAAKSYFKRTKEKLGVSIGFAYPETSFDGTVYKQIRFIERSVCPHDAVANPWTSFQALKGDDGMNQTKASWMETVLGTELSQRVLKSADSATKELEGQVAFKAAEEETEKASPSAMQEAMNSMKAALGDATPEVKAAWSAFTKAVGQAAKDSQKDEKDEKKDADEGAVVLPPSQNELLQVLQDILKPLAEAVATNTEAMTAIDERTKALEARVTKSDEDAKEKADSTLRGAETYRGTAARDNVLDGEKAKELFGESKATDNPVAPYIDDLLKGGIH